MSSIVYDWSDTYDWRRQSKCINCGLVYDMTPEYGYDNWYLGNFGCTAPKEYIKGYKDNGCPYCKKKAKEKEKAQIAEYQKNVKKCPNCGKAEIISARGKYYIQCDCVMTKESASLKWIPKLIGIWNRAH